MSCYQKKSFWDEWYNQRLNIEGSVAEWSAPLTDSVLQRIRALIAEIPAPSDGRRLRIMELGCGASSLATELSSDTVEMVGVDYSDEVIKIMRQRFPNLEWCSADALSLSDSFEEGSFDCIVAKTLLDCFLTRPEAEADVRRLFEQARKVLKDRGRFILLDKVEAPQLDGAGHVERMLVEEGGISKQMFLRHFTAQAAASTGDPDGGSSETNGGANQPLRFEAKLPPLGKDIETRWGAAGGLLVVQSAEGKALAAGLRPGDRLLGFSKKDGKALRFGEAEKIERALKASKSINVLVERPPEGAAGRRSASQADFLMRQQRATLLRAVSCGAGLAFKTVVSKKKKRNFSRTRLPSIQLPGMISAAVSPTLGLFD